MREPCSDCGEPYGVGDWPICADGTGKHGHQPPAGMHTFAPYLDEHISVDGKPQEISSWKQKQNLLKPHWYKDQLVHVRERGEVSRSNSRR